MCVISKSSRSSRSCSNMNSLICGAECCCAGLIRPHRGNFGAGEADRQHAEWQDLFVSAIPKVPMSDPSCCCKLAAAAAAHSSAARAAARASLDAAEPRVSPYLSCAVSALIIPPAEDEAASLLARVKVSAWQQPKQQDLGSIFPQRTFHNGKRACRGLDFSVLLRHSVFTFLLSVWSSQGCWCCP